MIVCLARRQLFSKAGFILLVVLGVLGTLSLIGLNIVQHAHKAQILSDAFVITTQARLNARSGIEKSLNSLRHTALERVSKLPFNQQWIYGGEDRNRDTQVSSQEDQWGNDNGMEEKEGAALRDALCPSLAISEASFRQSKLITVDDKKRGTSWNPDHHNSVMLKIESSDGQIDLNGGLDQHPDRAAFNRHVPTHPDGADAYLHQYNLPTRNLLNALGNFIRWQHIEQNTNLGTYLWDDPQGNDAVTIDHPNNLWLPAANVSFTFRPTADHWTTPGQWEFGLGSYLVDNRPGEGYHRMEDVKDLFFEWVATQRSHFETPDLKAEELWLWVKPLLTLNAKRKSFTKFWRQEGFEDGLLANRSLAYRDEDGARTYLRTRAYTHPRQLININVAPLPVLASVIYSVKKVFMREQLIPLGNQTPFSELKDFSNVSVVNRYPNSNNLKDNGAELSLFDKFNTPLFSMTEAVQMARQWIKERQKKSFTSYKEFYDYLAQYPYGFDFKSHSPLPLAGSANPRDANYASGLPLFLDLHQFNRRERILWCILNPNGNLRHFIWDEALPLTTQCKEFRYASWQPQATIDDLHYFRRTLHSEDEHKKFRSGKLNFDKSYPHEFGSEVSFFNGGRFQIEVLGHYLDPLGKVLAESRIQTLVDVWDTRTITDQKEFIEALSADPAFTTPHQATESHWITYPEVMVDHFYAETKVPATWDGQLALKPQTLIPLPGPGLSGVNSHLTLNPYDDSAPLTQKVGGGPTINWMPAGMTLLNSGYTPGQFDYIPWKHQDPAQLPSLLADHFDAVQHDLDATSHWIPGGGFFPDAQVSTRFDNGVDHPTQKTLNTRLAGFMIDDGQGGAGSWNHVIPDIKEGAVAFYFKPQDYPLPMTPGDGNRIVDDVVNPLVLGARTPYCLFDYPFLIHDTSLDTLIDTELSMDGYVAPLTQAGLLLGNIRLLFGNMWAQPTNKSEYADKRSWLHILRNRGLIDFNGRNHPAWTHDVLASVGSLIYPNPSTGPFLFPHMNGLSDAATGVFGYLKNGQESGHEFDSITPQAHHPYVSDRLWLEFKVSIVTMAQVVVDSGTNPREYKQIVRPSLFDRRYQVDGAYLDLYDSESHSVGPSGPVSLNLYKGATFDGGRTSDVHTVVKSFRLDHPLVFDANDVNRGLGPEDEELLPQSIFNHGRWHHLLIAWRNMQRLLHLNDVPAAAGDPARGGAIALYHNGTFKKSVVTGNATWDYNGMFWHSDFSNGYANQEMYGTLVLSPAYESTQFIQRPSDVFYPCASFINYDRGNPAMYLLRNYTGNPQVSHAWPYSYVKGFGMEQDNYWSFRRRPSTRIGHLNFHVNHAFVGSTMHFSGQDTERVKVGGVPVNNYTHENLALMDKAVHRFFFGSAPTGVADLNFSIVDPATNTPSIVSHKYPANGAFMDIRIAAAPANNLLEASGGFVPQIPDFSYSPYPSVVSYDQNLMPPDSRDNSRLFPLAPFPETKGGALMGFHWTAYLPPFHRFWDDVNGQGWSWDVTHQQYTWHGSNFPGPDHQDQQTLDLILQENDHSVIDFTTPLGWSRVSGEQELHLEQARPREHNRNMVSYKKIISIPDNLKQLSLKINFSVGDGSQPSSCYSTPLIDDLTIFYTPKAGKKFIYWRQN